ncbi:dihydrofolate reductase [Janibacter hoylei]|uniref:dihydrofolate reductase n=1 Tax=Janibacter hoylei TaxID=364298 RepID=UPI0022386AD7|nr:dihydrofolate reductase [Janibacter hoylei]MCW4600828.1 dihydrofolate reductase [Janibacter hoylei]
MSLPRPVPEELRGRVPLLAAAYAVMTREGDGGTEVLLQLRRGTGFMDGWWACGAAGHVEDASAPSQALAREVDEELGVRVLEATPLTTVQRSTLAGVREQRADFFFHVTAWSGEPTLREPDKAADLRWWPLAELPALVVPHERVVLEGLRDGGLAPFVELGHDQRLVLVAALGANRAIGVDGGMPWHLPEDLAHFKALTMGGTMIMGAADLGLDRPGAAGPHDDRRHLRPRVVGPRRDRRPLARRGPRRRRPRRGARRRWR